MLAELLPQVQGALEVPRDGLVHIGSVPILIGDPVGQALVQLGPDLLRQAAVRGLPHHRVREAPPPRGLLLGVHEPALVQRRDRRLELGDADVGGQCTEGADAEPPALDRRPLQ